MMPILYYFKSLLMNYYPVTVIDNFYENPQAIRDFALKQDFVFRHEIAENIPVYPGSRTKDLLELDEILYHKICEKFTSVFHNFKHDLIRWSISTSFQSVTEDFEYGIIHQDHDTVFAGVLFLTPNAPLNSGTSLFKENSSFNQENYIKSLKENDDRFKNNLKINSDYHNMFDEIVRVNNVYNSLIIYEGQHHHAANHFFGKTRETSRLTQVFFVKRVDAKAGTTFPLSRTKQIKL